MSILESVNPVLEVAGKFYVEGSATCLDVLVCCDARGRILISNHDSDEIILQTHKEDAYIAPKIGSVPREISFAGSGLLVLASQYVVDEYFKTATREENISVLEKRPSFILLCCVLVPVLLFSIFKYAIPYAAIIFAKYVPQEVVELASKQTLQALDKIILEPSQLSEETRAVLQEHWMQLMDDIGEDASAFNIQFRYAEEIGPNAFALPNGTIVFTDQMVELMAADKNLLSAILLHELGHVKHQHSMRLVAETIATALAIDYFLGDLGATIEAFGGISANVLQNKFSQTLEWEADNFALDVAIKAGLDPIHFARAMETLASYIGTEHDQDSSFMMSHPSMTERINNARDKSAESSAVKQEGATYKALDD